VWDDLGDKRNACRVLVGIPERKRLLGSPRHEIKMDLKETGWQHFMVL
jgi:hypothetical protein